jgi:hypothetical protein
MQLAFNDETFRDDYPYANSVAGIKRLLFPYAEDEYMYSVNIEPPTKVKAGLVSAYSFDIDEHYLAECRDKALSVVHDSWRYLAWPQMMDARANDDPQHFSLYSAIWTWAKRLRYIQPDVHADLIESKGKTKFHPFMVDGLAQFDDGALLAVGTQLD